MRVSLRGLYPQYTFFSRRDFEIDKAMTVAKHNGALARRMQTTTLERPVTVESFLRTELSCGSKSSRPLFPTVRAFILPDT
jgi:hypothetical protein